MVKMNEWGNSGSINMKTYWRSWCGRDTPALRASCEANALCVFFVRHDSGYSSNTVRWHHCASVSGRQKWGMSLWKGKGTLRSHKPRGGRKIVSSVLPVCTWATLADDYYKGWLYSCYIWCSMSQLPSKDTVTSVVIMTLGTTVEMYAIISLQRILFMFQNVTSQQEKMITIFHLGINYDSTVAAPASWIVYIFCQVLFNDKLKQQPKLSAIISSFIFIVKQWTDNVAFPS